MLADLTDFWQVLIFYVLAGTLLTAQVTAYGALAKKGGVSSDLVIITGFAISSLVAYVVFYLYCVSTDLGRAASYMALIGPILSLVFVRLPLKSLLPFAAAMGVGLFYLCLAYLRVDGVAPDLPANMFFERGLPHDHRIPLMFAEAVYQKLPSRTGMDIWGWYFSDRPPLQTGFVLLFSPMWEIGSTELTYRALGTLLQVSCFLGVIQLLRIVSRGRSETMFCLLAVALCGFTYYNSIYAWPKLLAAGYFLSALSILIVSIVSHRRLEGIHAALVGALIALAMVSHAGIVFSVIGLGMLCVFLVRRIVSVRSFGAMVLAATVIYLPWTAYGKLVDPSPGRLIVINLAGTDPVGGNPPNLLDPSKVSILRQVVTAYSKITPSTWFQWKAMSIRTLFSSPVVDQLLVNSWAGIVDSRSRAQIDQTPRYNITPANLNSDLLGIGTLLRVEQRDYMFSALGVLNLAWPLLLLFAIVTKRFHMSRASWLLGVVTFLGLSVFVVLMFLPGGTTTILGSYAAVLSLAIFASLLLFRTSRTIGWVILTANVALSAALWVWLVPAQMWPPDLPLQPWPITVALISGALSIGLLWRVAASAHDGEHPVEATKFDRNPSIAGGNSQVA